MEYLLSTKLVEFEIDTRALCALERKGVKTLGDLTELTERELGALPRMGVLAVGRIKEVLASLDLQLRDE